jgi:hypothetical protein
MPAFSLAIMQQLQSNIRRLLYQRQKLAGLQLSNDEFVDTFVQAPHRQMFKDIAPLLVTSTSRKLSWATGGAGTVQLYATAGGEAPLPMPKHIDVQPDAPHEIVERIDSWIANGGDVSRDFGRVLTTLYYLNQSCSRSAMRYYWPTIMAICSVDPATQAIGNELQELRTLANPAPLPHGVIAACRKTAETVATAKLIPLECEYPANTGVMLGVQQGMQYTEPGIGRFAGMT